MTMRVGDCGCWRLAPTALLVIALLLSFGHSCLASVNAEAPLAEMNHTTWTARDGAPQSITALAQSSDGILWIGTEGGLFTFDGRSFSTFRSDPGQPDVPAGAVTSIFAARDGTVWIGFAEGTIGHVTRRRMTLFTNSDHHPLCCALGISEAADGGIWAIIAQQYLVRLGGDGKWREQQSPVGPSAGRMNGIFIDSSNTLWVAQGGRLYRRPLDQSHYYPTQALADWTMGFAESRDHSMWVTDILLSADRGRTQRVDRFGKLLNTFRDPEEAYALLTAADGSLIMGTQHDGLRRYTVASLTPGAQTGEPETYTHLDGLSSDAPAALLVDVDGNIWVGGRHGLDRFRRARLTPFVTKAPAGVWSVCANKRGTVWIAGETNQLYEITPTGTRSYQKAGDTYSSFCGNNGDTWLVDRRGIWRWNETGAQLFPPIPRAQPHGVGQVVATMGNRLYASVITGWGDDGIWQYDGHWLRLKGRSIFPRPPHVLYLDTHDRLWAGYRRGLVGLISGGSEKMLSSGSPGLGTVYALLDSSHGMFAAGLNGLAVLRKNRFELLSFADRISSQGVAGLVESRNGDLWLNASHGIVHIAAADLLASLKNVGLALKSTLVTEGNFVGPARLALGLATSARDGQGNLWFATENGVFHLDPDRPRAKRHVPIVTIKSVSADGNSLGENAAIGPYPKALEIQYLGVDLTAPEDVIYRYRLDGFDTGWRNVGRRTEAIYTQLSPGTYTFRVTASNDGQHWTAPISTASITVLPSFYQTGWFLTICGSAALLLLWFAYTARVRAISRAIRARAEERADERIRIARELHDTLLQGIHGLLLTFHVAAQKIPSDHDSKPALDRALTNADRVIAEGRNRLNSLRSEHLSDSELIGSLENMGKDLGIADNVTYRVRRAGISAKLNPDVVEEVFYISREALTNAIRHAAASQISVELNYKSRLFEMVCQDNGRGFDISNLAKPGHWGLKGMLERAKKLGGNLDCRSVPMQGSMIIFTLPSWRAYKDYSRVVFWIGTVFSGWEQRKTA